MEKTFIMIKPDGVERKLVGKIVSRFEEKGFNLVATKFEVMNEDVARMHYVEHLDKPFYDSLVEFITSGPVFCMVIEGESVVELSRVMIGATNPLAMIPGTIRGDYSANLSKNIIHGSDSVDSANREISLHFPDLGL